MKRIKAYAELEYVEGRTRYGHLEQEVWLEEEEFQKFKANPFEYARQNEEEFFWGPTLIIDDYDIDGYGPIEELTYEVLDEEETNSN